MFCLHKYVFIFTLLRKKLLHTMIEFLILFLQSEKLFTFLALFYLE